MPYRNKTPDQIRQAIAESAMTEATRPRKTPTAEIVAASEGAIVPPRSREDVEAMIARIVRERVDEIMVKVKAGQVEPDFLLKDEAAELRWRQDVFERRKWSLYFEKYGCRTCHRKNASNFGTGHCKPCYQLIAQRLKQLRAEYERDHPDAEIDRQIDRLTSRFRVAKSLLKGGEE